LSDVPIRSFNDPSLPKRILESEHHRVINFCPRNLARFIVPIFFALPVLASPSWSGAQIGVSITVGVMPPPIPVYAQPPIREEGYLWVPGYWEFFNGAYRWHPRYWGRHVGYYGGINYGFGYFGFGYIGGSWDHGRLCYNIAINNFGSHHITNVYRQAPRNVGRSRAAFVGSRCGTAARHSADEQRALSELQLRASGAADPARTSRRRSSHAERDRQSRAAAGCCDTSARSAKPVGGNRQPPQGEDTPAAGDRSAQPVRASDRRRGGRRIVVPHIDGPVFTGLRRAEGTQCFDARAIAPRRTVQLAMAPCDDGPFCRRDALTCSAKKSRAKRRAE
jgi:hypothetical protein